MSKLEAVNKAALDQLQSGLEKLIEQWVERGAHPKDLQIVQENTPAGITFYVTLRQNVEAKAEIRKQENGAHGVYRSLEAGGRGTFDAPTTTTGWRNKKPENPG
jgi:hypothetical protein